MLPLNLSGAVAKNCKNICRYGATRNLSKTVGFIGCGNMGGFMVANILKSSWISGGSVIVHDIVPENVMKMTELGATAAMSIADLASKSDIIVTMLPATKHVEGVLTSEDGVFANAKPGSFIVDSSTISPTASKELVKKAAEYSLKMVDAPVSGGVTGAEAGTLTFMVGGEVALYEEIKAFLGSTMGKNIVHCGGSGSGGVAKICNNMALAISMIGTSEAMALGIKNGMDPAVLANIMNTSTARCWSSDTYNPVPGILPNVPSSKNYAGGFGTALIEKDLTLATSLASECKQKIPLGSQSHQLYGFLCNLGYGGKDFGVVYEFLSKDGSKPL